MTALLLLLACGGVNDETVLSELRVLAMVAEPPEVGPGQSTTVTSWIADPTKTGFEVLTWACTDLGEGCLEPTLGVPWYAVGEPERDGSGLFGRSTSTFTVPAIGGGPPGGGPPARPAPPAPWWIPVWHAMDATDTGATDTGDSADTADTGATDTDTADTGATDTGGALPPALPLTALYTLACAPDTCPVIAKARAGALDATDVADVSALMAGLPIAVTSLATRRLWLGSGVAPHGNPTLELVELERAGDPPFKAGDTLTFRFRVTGTLGGEPFAYGYALGGGGFDSTRYRIDPATGEVNLTWVAGETLDADALAMVVVNDGLGGSAFMAGLLGP